MQHATAQDTEWLIHWLLSFSMHSTTQELHTRRRKTHTRWQKQTRLLHTTAGSFLYSSNDTARAIWRYFFMLSKPDQKREKTVYEPKTLKVSHIQFVYDKKTRQVCSCTICIRVENASGETYTYCIRAKNSTKQNVYNMYTSRKRVRQAVYSLYTSRK